MSSSTKSVGSRIEDFARKTKMVFRMATMPSWREFWQTFKIILLLVVILGFIGFAIRILIQSFVGVLRG